MPHTARLGPGTEGVCGVVLPGKFSTDSTQCLSRPESLLLTPCLKAAWSVPRPVRTAAGTRCGPSPPGPAVTRAPVPRSAGSRCKNRVRGKSENRSGPEPRILDSTSHQEHRLLWAPPTSRWGQPPPLAPHHHHSAHSSLLVRSILAETPAIHITSGAQFWSDAQSPPPTEGSCHQWGPAGSGLWAVGCRHPVTCLTAGGVSAVSSGPSWAESWGASALGHGLSCKPLPLLSPAATASSSASRGRRGPTLFVRAILSMCRRRHQDAECRILETWPRGDTSPPAQPVLPPPPIHALRVQPKASPPGWGPRQGASPEVTAQHLLSRSTPGTVTGVRSPGPPRAGGLLLVGLLGSNLQKAREGARQPGQSQPGRWLP